MANNSWTKTYADGAALTEGKIDTGLQTLKIDVSNTDNMTTGSTSGQVFTSNGAGLAGSFQTIADPVAQGARNVGLSASTSSGSLTVALKTNAGTNPTATDILDITFSSSGTTSAVGQKYSLTTSLSLTITASATLGTLSATTSTIYVYAVRVSSTTLRLAVANRGDLSFGGKQATLAMSASADAPDKLYSNASAGTYPVQLLGYVSASNTSGSWNAIYSTNLVGAGAFFRSATTVVGASVSLGGTAVSNGSGSFICTGTVSTLVTSSSISIVCSGRPVVIDVIPDPSNTTDFSYIASGLNTGSAIESTAWFTIKRINGTTTTTISTAAIDSRTYGVIVSGIQTKIPPGSLNFIDYGAPAGTNTYKLYAQNSTANGRAYVFRTKLVAYERRG